MSIPSGLESDPGVFLKDRIRVGMSTLDSRRVGDPTHTVLKFWIEDRYKESIFEKFVRTKHPWK